MLNCSGRDINKSPTGYLDYQGAKKKEKDNAVAAQC